MTSRKPPSQRDAEYASRHQGRQLQSMSPGAVGGRFASAQPVLPSTSDAEFGGDQGGTGVEMSFMNEDIFTLGSSGAQTLALTYLPDPMSLHVALNGVHARKGTDWTVTDQTLSLLTPLDPRTGDVVTTEYVYLDGVPLLPTEPMLLNIPFQASGWKAHTLASSSLLASYVDPATDDSSWADATCPVGWGSFTDIDGHAVSTVLAHVNTGQLGHEEDFVVRRLIAPGTSITVDIDESNYCYVYVDGTLISTHATGIAAKYTLSVSDQTAPWLLAVYITVGNGSTAGGVDIAVAGLEA